MLKHPGVGGTSGTIIICREWSATTQTKSRRHNVTKQHNYTLARGEDANYILVDEYVGVVIHHYVHTHTHYLMACLTASMALSDSAITHSAPLLR